MSVENPNKASRGTLWLVAAVCIAPFVASFATYYFWQPAGRVNYGDLLPPSTVPAEPLTLSTGEPFAFDKLRGKWAFVTVDNGACDEYCAQKLWKMRQVRRTQGKNMDRVERVLLIADGKPLDPALAREYEGTWIVATPDSRLARELPHSGSVRDHIYLVDPLGNIMLRYPKDANPTRMKKDLERLLRVSRIG